MKRLSLPFTFRLPCLAYFLFLFSGTPSVQGLPLIKKVPYQPFVAATQRLLEALDFCGAPLEAEDVAAIQRAIRRDPSEQTCDALQNILDRYCIVGVNINAESRVKVAEGPARKLTLKEGRSVRITCDFAALLAKEPTEETERIRKRRLDAKPYWHIERARIGNSRKVPVELIVNGAVVANKAIEADGVIRSLAFDIPIDRSSWVAIRVLASVHTNPIFVEVDGKSIRADLKSAEWCREAVDVCWNAKHGKIRDADQDAAKKAYQHARDVYDRIIAESK